MTNPLLARFIPEARELLESSSSSLLALEKRPDDAAAVNEVFRAVHTLKGSSGLFDVVALTKLVHVAEDLLGAVRADKLALNPDIVDDLFAAFDQVSVWIGHMEETERLPADADKVSGKLSRLLRAHLAVPGEAEAAPVAAAAGAVDPARRDEWLALFDADARAVVCEKLVKGRDVTLIRYIPPANAFFCGSDPLNLVLGAPGLIAAECAPERPIAPLSEYEPYQCNLVFTALCAENEDEIAQHLRYEMEHVTLCVLRAEFFPQEAPQEARANAPGAPGPAPRHVVLARSIVANQRRALFSAEYAPERITAAASAVARLAASLRRLDWAAAAIAAANEANAHASTAPVLSLLENIDADLADFADEHAGEAAPPAEQPRAPAPQGRVVEMPPRAPAKAVAAVGETAPERREHEKRETKKSLRVDQAKIDLLMNLIGELTVSKNSLPFLARRAEDVYGSREMSREIKDQYAVIDRLAQEMQSAIMAVRMLPVSDVFDRFPRLVRDVARRLGKEVELTVEGGDTAADKTIIEALGDPLLHIVRNSLDHGVEPADERRGAEKPVVAALALRAYQEADSVIIEVEDDGRGIDPARIRAAAIEKGVISAERAAAMSDSEAVNLIFAPGFSTAKQVSDLSGRGVGLDVVRTAIEGFGGRVQIVSKPGKGALTRLILPLSMAVTRIMIIEGAGGVYGVPMDMIVETVRIDAARIRRVKQSEAFVLREQLIPLVRLSALLGESPREKDADAPEAVLVCRVNGRIVGLVIDDFRIGMDVVLKPLEGIVATARGFSGTTLLGDGRVLLVLDLKELL
jgi:two-component system chemotaxis sensor kinase CheA